MKVGSKFVTDKGSYQVKAAIPYNGKKIFYVTGIRKGLPHHHFEVENDYNGVMSDTLSEAKQRADYLFRKPSKKGK